MSNEESSPLAKLAQRMQLPELAQGIASLADDLDDARCPADPRAVVALSMAAAFWWGKMGMDVRKVKPGQKDPPPNVPPGLEHLIQASPEEYAGADWKECVRRDLVKLSADERKLVSHLWQAMAVLRDVGNGQMSPDIVAKLRRVAQGIAPAQAAAAQAQAAAEQPAALDPADIGNGKTLAKAAVDAARDFYHSVQSCDSAWRKAIYYEEQRNTAAKECGARTEPVREYAAKCDYEEEVRNDSWKCLKESAAVLIAAARAWNMDCAALNTLRETFPSVCPLPGICGVDPKGCMPPDFRPAMKEADAIGKEAEIRAALARAGVDDKSAQQPAAPEPAGALAAQAQAAAATAPPVALAKAGPITISSSAPGQATITGNFGGAFDVTDAQVAQALAKGMHVTDAQFAQAQAKGLDAAGRANAQVVVARWLNTAGDAFKDMEQYQDRPDQKIFYAPTQSTWSKPKHFDADTTFLLDWLNLYFPDDSDPNQMRWLPLFHVHGTVAFWSSNPIHQGDEQSSVRLAYELPIMLNQAWRLLENHLAAALPADAAPEPAEAPRSQAKANKKEANIAARKYLKEHPKATARELVKGIGCSIGLVSQLPAWKAVQEQRKKGRQPKAGVVSLTKKLEQTAGAEDESLNKLINEQAEDAEPSPLDDDPPAERQGAPRKAKVYRKP